MNGFEVTGQGGSEYLYGIDVAIGGKDKACICRLRLSDHHMEFAYEGDANYEKWKEEATNSPDEAAK